MRFGGVLFGCLFNFVEGFEFIVELCSFEFFCVLLNCVVFGFDSGVCVFECDEIDCLV